MNIAELNQALHAIADEVTDDSKTRLASVDPSHADRPPEQGGRNHRDDLPVVMALVFLPNWRGLSDSDPAPQADNSLFGSLATVRTGDLLIYKDAGGVRLLKARVAVRWAPTRERHRDAEDRELGWTQPCQLSAPASCTTT